MFHDETHLELVVLKDLDKRVAEPGDLHAFADLPDEDDGIDVCANVV